MSRSVATAACRYSSERATALNSWGTWSMAARRLRGIGAILGVGRVAYGLAQSDEQERVSSLIRKIEDNERFDWIYNRFVKYPYKG